MSEDSPSHASPGAAASPSASPLRSAKHIGIDDVANDAHPTAAGADAPEEKPAATNTHKGKSLRWQSLLPGVMK
jgi:hypothetical protein